MAADEREYDLRLIERKISKGLMKREEYDKFLKGLDDKAELADTVKVEFERSDEETDAE